MAKMDDARLAYFLAQIAAAADPFVWHVRRDCRRQVAVSKSIDRLPSGHKVALPGPYSLIVVNESI